MAKIKADVLLKDGTDEVAFINDVTSNSEVDLNDRLSSIPTLVVLDVEESYFNTLRSHSSVVSIEVEAVPQPPVTYPSKPPKYTLSDKSIGGVWEGGGWNFNTTYPGTKWISYQHYLDTDLMVAPERTINSFTGSNVGNHHYDSDPEGKRDQMRFLGTAPSNNSGSYGDDQTYSSYYTGKNVDIVTVEGGTTPPDNDYVGYHTHPDYDDPDNTGTTRCIPMDWTGLSDSANNQVTSNKMLNSHGTGTLSAACGIHGGFAKKSKLRAMYLSNVSITTALNSVITWHNAKSVNGSTGLKDPTVLITEWHHPPTNKEKAIKVEDIDSVTDPDGGTTNRPGGGWGSDMTPFTSRLIIPFQLLDPNTSTWHWVIPFQTQSQASYHVAIESCWDNGIVVVTSCGNGGGIFVKDSDPRWNGTYCTISGTKDLYTMDYGDAPNDSQNDPCKITKSTTSTTNWYPLRAYGPAGTDKAITVAFNEDNQVILESFLDGIEVAVGVISYDNDIIVLPITEIVTDNEFFDYNAKYKGEADEITPARISYQMTLQIKSIAKKIYEILDMKGFSRSEFIIQNDEIFLLEVNSVPGLTNESILPKQANAAGIELKDLFSNAINEAIN